MGEEATRKTIQSKIIERKLQSPGTKIVYASAYGTMSDTCQFH